MFPFILFFFICFYKIYYLYIFVKVKLKIIKSSMNFIANTYIFLYDNSM